MIDKNKCNEELGKEVNEYLTKLGINTPVNEEKLSVSDDVKIDKIAELTKQMLETLGMDLTDDSLEETPKRVAKMYVNEIFSGLQNKTFPRCMAVENKFCHGDEFVLEKNIKLYSSCEHHLLTIDGVAHVAYIPGDKVLGISKLNRLVGYFSTRPQVQERLTQQIAHAISYVCETEDVIVAIDAKHLCVAQRGIKDINSSTMTLAALGKFGDHNSERRREFMAALN